MSMRTNYDLRRALGRSVQVFSKRERISYIANVILGDLDDVLIRSASHLSDMGLTATEFAKVKRAIKKRL
jgi:hypothetical protein